MVSNLPLISRSSWLRMHSSRLVGLSDSDSKRRDARKLCAIRSRRAKRVAHIAAYEEGKTVKRIISIACVVLMLLAATTSNTLALGLTAGHGDGGVTAGHGDGGVTV